MCNNNWKTYIATHWAIKMFGLHVEYYYIYGGKHLNSLIRDIKKHTYTQYEFFNSITAPSHVKLTITNHNWPYCLRVCVLNLHFDLKWPRVQVENKISRDKTLYECS